MSDMKKLLTIVSESGEKARIDEGVNVSINVSGDSPCDVGEVLAKVTNLSSPRPVTPDMMPATSAPPPMPMVKAIDIVGKADEPTGPAVPPAPPGDMAPHTAPEAIGQSVMMPDPSEEPTGGPSTSSQVVPPEMDESDPEDFDDDDDNPYDTIDDIPDHRYNEEEKESLLDPAMPSAHSEEESSHPAVSSLANKKNDIASAKSKIENMRDLINKIRGGEDTEETFANEPDPKISDINYMNNTLSVNKKTMHPHSYKQGDNPMAMEATVRSEWEKYKLGE